MADVTTPFGFPYPEPTDLVRDGATDIENLAEGVNDYLTAGYLYAGTRYYTSSGTFAKADPLGTGDIGLRAIRVRMVGGGGGSGGAGTTGAGEMAASSGGGGGGYAEKFITDIAGLDATETITRGAGGAGGASGANAGSAGGNSSAFSVQGNGGGGGPAGAGQAFAAFSATVAQGGDASGGDLNVQGGGAVHPFGFSAGRPGQSTGGKSALGEPKQGRVSIASNGDAPPATGFGAGATGAVIRENTASTRSGAAGATGIVVIDCYV